jgi:hypothetical protein
MPTADLAIFTVVYTTVVLVAHMGPRTMHGAAGGGLSLWVVYHIATGATAELGSVWTPGVDTGTPAGDRDDAIGFLAVVLVMGMCAVTSGLCAVAAHRSGRPASRADRLPWWGISASASQSSSPPSPSQGKRRGPSATVPITERGGIPNVIS